MHSIFTTPTSGIRAYTGQLTADAKNMASVGAVAGKPFSSFVSFSDKPSRISTVDSTTTRNMSAVGEALQSSIRQNFSIDGQGLVPVVRGDQTINNQGFARNCTFSLDANKKLVNSQGHYLQGWVLENGQVPNQTVGALQTLSFDGLKQDPVATANLSLQARLNSGADVGTVFGQTLDVYDSLGNAKPLTFTWTKSDSTSVAYNNDNATQSWTLVVTDPTDVATIQGSYGDGGMRVEFNSAGQPVAYDDIFNGTVQASNPTPPELNIIWNTAANPSAINLNLGTVGTNNGVISASGTSQSLGTKKDGSPPGIFSDVEVDPAGNVRVTFSNNQVISYAQVPLALFNNVNGIEEKVPGFFIPNYQSGDYIFSQAGQGGAGRITSGTYEGSATEGTETYVGMLKHYQHLAFNLKPLSIGEKVYDAVLQLV